jgi:hypothetical protein
VVRNKGGGESVGRDSGMEVVCSQIRIFRELLQHAVPGSRADFSESLDVG